MAFLDFFIGKKGLDKQRRLADDFVNRYYDPGQYNPALDEARSIADEGINQDLLRSSLVERIFTSTQAPMTSVGQGSSLAALQLQDQNRADALSDAEVELGIKNEEAKLQGRQSVAQILTKIREQNAKRTAGLAQNRLLIESEANRRKMSLVGNVLKLGGAAALAATGNPGPALDIALAELQDAPDAVNLGSQPTTTESTLLSPATDLFG